MTRTMKDSGIKWIGFIPKHWPVSKFKYSSIMYTGNSIKDSEKDEYSSLEMARPYISTKNIDLSNNTINYESGIYIKVCNKTFKIAPANSTLMCIEGGSAGKKKAFLAQSVCFVNKLCCFIANNNYNSKYIYYFLTSPNYEDEFISNIEGLIGGVSINKLKTISILCPSLPEQQAIADYLDDKCAQIDNITATINEQIEVLKQYKKSVITEAVTKGLDHNVPMKDSGVEWIGKIPEHWTLKPFEFILKERSLKNNPILTDERLALSIDKGITLYSEKTTNLDRFKDDVSLYKVVYPGDFVMNSMNMIVGAVGITPYFGCVSPAYYVFYDENTEHTKARFCDYIFRSKTIRKYLFSIGKGIMAIERGDDRVNTCRLKVSRYDLNKLKIPQPPYIEQTQILNYLDDKCAKIDAVIADKQAQLETLAAYKKSLIYEYVTGKKSVPGFEEA